MPLDLDDTDKAALVELLRGVFGGDPFPLSPRIRKLRAILDKLDPPPPRPEPFLAPKPAGEPRRGSGEQEAPTAFSKGRRAGLRRENSLEKVRLILAVGDRAMNGGLNGLTMTAAGMIALNEAYLCRARGLRLSHARMVGRL
jgi:hypothetical protein